MSDTLELLRAQLKTNACTTFAGAACCTPPGNCDCYVAAQAITEIERLRANAPYAVQLREALESANTTLAHIHDRHLPNVDTRDREGERPGPNDDAQTVNDCNEASAVIERALANRPQGTMADEQGDPRIGDTYTAPVPPGYRHDDRCAYRVSVRNHCTCGYVDKEGA